jgi:predicted NBD/HSP70 family sugar kinase
MDKKTITFAAKSISRQMSVRAVLRAVREHGVISRAELSRQTGFSKQTTSDVVSELLHGGWLREAGHTSGNVGRTATNYELNGARAHVFGCDLGGTKINLAIADLNGRVIAERTEPTRHLGGLAVVDQIAGLVAELAAESAVAPESILCGALGAPGAYDRGKDRLRLVSNVDGLEDFGIASHFRKALGIPVFIENDVTIAAKGERWAGAGSGLDTFVFMAMGTGIGLGIVSDGKVVRGAHGGAGEIASLPLGGNPFDSRNFQSGALESVISSAAILQRYKASGGTGAETVAQIFERLTENDRHAIAVVDETARLLALAIVAVCAIIDPQAVITGGSIGSRAELIDRVSAILALCSPNPVRIQISPLGRRAALVGAVGTALDNLHETYF